jgi:hypothetical protein
MICQVFEQWWTAVLHLFDSYPSITLNYTQLCALMCAAVADEDDAEYLSDRLVTAYDNTVPTKILLQSIWSYASGVEMINGKAFLSKAKRRLHHVVKVPKALRLELDIGPEVTVDTPMQLILIRTNQILKHSGSLYTLHYPTAVDFDRVYGPLLSFIHMLITKYKILEGDITVGHYYVQALPNLIPSDWYVPFRAQEQVKNHIVLGNDVWITQQLHDIYAGVYEYEADGVMPTSQDAASVHTPVMNDSVSSEAKSVNSSQSSVVVLGQKNIPVATASSSVHDPDTKYDEPVVPNITTSIKRAAQSYAKTTVSSVSNADSSMASAAALGSKWTTEGCRLTEIKDFVKVIVAAKKSMFRQFNGSTAHRETFDRWIVEFQSVLKTVILPLGNTYVRYKILEACLQGPAVDYIRTFYDDATDTVTVIWPHLLKSFIKEYTTSSIYEKALVKLKTFHLPPYRNIYDLKAELVQLIITIKNVPDKTVIPEQDFAQVFLSALPDPVRIQLELIKTDKPQQLQTVQQVYDAALVFYRV